MVKKKKKEQKDISMMNWVGFVKEREREREKIYQEYLPKLKFLYLLHKIFSSRYDNPTWLAGIL